MCTIYDSSKCICLLLLFVFARFCMVLFWMLSSHVREDLSFLIIPPRQNKDARPPSVPCALLSLLFCLPGIPHLSWLAGQI